MPFVADEISTALGTVGKGTAYRVGEQERIAVACACKKFIVDSSPSLFIFGKEKPFLASRACKRIRNVFFKKFHIFFPLGKITV